MSDNTLPVEFFERFPNSILQSRLSRIWEQMLKTWGTEEGIKYLNSLLLVEDGRSRQGFDSDTMSELFFLENSHEKLFPQFPSIERNMNYSFANDHNAIPDI